MHVYGLLSELYKSDIDVYMYLYKILQLLHSFVDFCSVPRAKHNHIGCTDWSIMLHSIIVIQYPTHVHSLMTTPTYFLTGNVYFTL